MDDLEKFFTDLTMEIGQRICDEMNAEAAKHFRPAASEFVAKTPERRKPAVRSAVKEAKVSSGKKGARAQVPRKVVKAPPGKELDPSRDADEKSTAKRMHGILFGYVGAREPTGFTATGPTTTRSSKRVGPRGKQSQVRAKYEPKVKKFAAFQKAKAEGIPVAEATKMMASEPLSEQAVAEWVGAGFGPPSEPSKEGLTAPEMKRLMDTWASKAAGKLAGEVAKKIADFMNQ